MKKNWLILLGTILVIVFFERFLTLTSVFEHLELITYDLRAKLATDKGPFGNKFENADKNIVLLAVDDYSRKQIAKNPQLKIGSWPWRRDVWSGVVNFIQKGKPKAILFDLIFNELNENSWNDRRFAQSLRRHNNIVLATSLNDPKYLVDKLIDHSDIINSNYLPTSTPLDVDIKDKNIENAITYYSHAPVHNLYTRDNMMGVVNKVPAIDAVIREAQPLFKLNKNGKIYYMPSLAFAGFLKYMGKNDKIIIKNHKLFYKDRVIPLSNEGTTNISWHGLGKDYDYIPISKLLLSEDTNEYINPNFFKDKIVIIGRTEAGTDIHPSAVSHSYLGPEANATALDNFINDSYNHVNGRKFLTKTSQKINFALVVFACILIGVIGTISKNAFVCFLNGFTFIILYILLCIWAFTEPTVRLWIPMAVPLYYLLMTSAIIFTYKFQQELSKRATVLNMFGKFVSPKVLATLLKNQDDIKLKNTKKRITMMFCDVKDFTTLSEKYSPEQLVDNMNELFNEIVNIIFENNGTVDKFMGDCVMAYWGDPIANEDDAFMAVKTALEIKKRINELKITNAKENKIILDVKIGINTGDALLGLSGSEKLMSYTAMGDAVNVASRLESNCSKLNRDILISKSTYDDTKTKVIVLDAGKISVKGRVEQIEIFEPIGLSENSTCEQTENKNNSKDETNSLDD